MDCVVSPEALADLETALDVMFLAGMMAGALAWEVALSGFYALAEWARKRRKLA